MSESTEYYCDFFFFTEASIPFRSPGNHGNEEQERTLSCWRPDPGFGAGNEPGRGIALTFLQAIRQEMRQAMKKTQQF